MKKKAPLADDKITHVAQERAERQQVNSKKKGRTEIKENAKTKNLKKLKKGEDDPPKKGKKRKTSFKKNMVLASFFL